MIVRTTQLKAVFAAFTLLALAIPASIAHIAGFQQAQTRPVFEVATIKLADANAIRNQLMPTSPNRLYIPSMSLVWLIYAAYGDGGFNTSMRVSGGPAWTNTTSYAVEAVASGTPTYAQLRQMLQTLLEQRFALKVRTDMTTIDTNVLVVDRPDGKLGPKVKEWDGTCRNGKPTDLDDPSRPRCASLLAPPYGYRPGGIFFEGATMFNVGELLSLPQGRPLGAQLQDQTGLTGRYTMELTFTAPRAAEPGIAPEPGPSLATAIKEQWGLRIERGKGPFRSVVIEHAEQPTPN